MRLLVWLAFAGIAYTYLGYPALIWLLSRFCGRRWTARPITPSISVVLAVHNSAELLPEKIKHLLSLDYPNVREVIIVSDGSTDETENILATIENPACKSIVLKEHRGKAAAVNAGAAQASGDLVLFVDIRPRIGHGAVQHLVSNFADPHVGCAAGELSLQDKEHDAMTRAIGNLYWRYEQWIRKCESGFDSPVGVYGGFYAVRRELIVPQPEGIILDDLFQPLSIIRQGYRSVLDPRAKVYDTWPRCVEREFLRKVRTLAGNYQLCQILPWCLSPRNPVLFQFVSHKLMRLIVPYLLILFLICSAVLSTRSTLYALLTGLQILGWMVALASLRYEVPFLHRIAAPIGALLVLNVAAVVGLYRFLTARGELWKIWNSGHLATKE